MELTKEKIQELKAEAHHLEPVARVGKNGLNENNITDINKLLKKRKLIKIKLVKGSIEEIGRKELAKIVAQKTNSHLIQCIGQIVVLYKS